MLYIKFSEWLGEKYNGDPREEDWNQIMEGINSPGSHLSDMDMIPPSYTPTHTPDFTPSPYAANTPELY